jgi:heat-inducible transcriptional repressor
MEDTQILTDRQKLILTLVIHEFTRSATPVGSKNLVKRYQLDMSPATVRNELAALVDLGYLENSYGRVPTVEGYRYFVSNLLQETELPDSTRHMISHQFYQKRHEAEDWMRLAASVLAYHSHAASLVTAPRPSQGQIKHLELISTRGRQILLVVVTTAGEIHQRLVTHSDPVSQEQLSAEAEKLTSHLKNREIGFIETIRSQVDPMGQSVLDWVLEALNQTDMLTGDVFTDGLSNVLDEPEFAGGQEARKALRILEERSLLQELLARTAPANNLGGVQVLIGGEGNWEELRQCSMVLARFGAPGSPTGTLGVLGPMRMPYGRAISTVRFIASLLSEMMTESMSN